jgi:hypothetical protein
MPTHYNAFPPAPRQRKSSADDITLSGRAVKQSFFAPSWFVRRKGSQEKIRETGSKRRPRPDAFGLLGVPKIQGGLQKSPVEETAEFPIQ